MRLLNVRELSEILHVAQPTLYEWVRKKRIPYIKIGACIRFNPSKIDEWLEKCSRETED